MASCVPGSVDVVAAMLETVHLVLGEAVVTLQALLRSPGQVTPLFCVIRAVVNHLHASMSLVNFMTVLRMLMGDLDGITVWIYILRMFVLFLKDISA